jgi:hypothetical protein
MKLAPIKTNQQQQDCRETETAERINTKKQEVKRETHLTVIGVCTTIRPENSGT